MTGLAASAPLVFIAYSVTAVALYARTLGMFFTSDDYYFLDLVARAQSPLVLFETLAGRFVRPIVVGMYYVTYNLFGLNPWPYHVATLIPHVVSGWFLYLTARRLGGVSETLPAFVAGLLFIAFGGHTEAVAWPAGIADPALTMLLAVAFYCYLRWIEPGAPRRWFGAMTAALLLASLAKEAWVMFPGLLIVHAVAFGRGGRFAGRRVGAIVLSTVLVASYVVWRHVVFGSALAGLRGLSSSLEGGIFVEQLRAFVLRSLLPSGWFAAGVWLTRLDLWIWIAVLVVIAVAARGSILRMVVFSALAWACALAPVLPLTISISTTESERYIYAASFFSSIFAVWTVRAVVRRPVAVGIVCAAFIAFHASALHGTNSLWRAAATVSRTSIESYADEARRHGSGGDAAIYLLSAPDNLRGAYVFRVGFFEGVRLLRPDVSAQLKRTIPVATNSMIAYDDPVGVARIGPRTFAVDFTHDAIVQPHVGASSMFSIPRQSRRRYEIEFTPAADGSLVLYISGGRTRFAGIVSGAE